MLVIKDIPEPFQLNIEIAIEKRLLMTIAVIVDSVIVGLLLLSNHTLHFLAQP